jgi:putative endonuclease
LSEHRSGEVDGFTKRYRLTWLVWFEHFRNVNDAIACEKTLKGWRRGKKIALIRGNKPTVARFERRLGTATRFYDRPWNTEEMVRDSSLRSE